MPQALAQRQAAGKPARFSAKRNDRLPTNMMSCCRRRHDGSSAPTPRVHRALRHRACCVRRSGERRGMLVRAARRGPRRRRDRCAQLSPRRTAARSASPASSRAGRPTQTGRGGAGRDHRRPRGDAARRRRHARPLRPPARFRVSRCLRNPGAGLLLAQGAALVSATVTDKDCAATLTAAEAAAREAKQGTWADPGHKKHGKSGRYFGRDRAVYGGRGQGSVGAAGGATTYLNFGRNWTRDFAVTISRRVLPTFQAAGIVLSRSKIDGFVSVAGSRRGAGRESKCSVWGRLKWSAGILAAEHE